MAGLAMGRCHGADSVAWAISCADLLSDGDFDGRASWDVSSPGKVVNDLECRWGSTGTSIYGKLQDGTAALSAKRGLTGPSSFVGCDDVGAGLGLSAADGGVVAVAVCAAYLAAWAWGRLGAAL